eukprot:2967-Rhodomonas_salina.1
MHKSFARKYFVLIPQVGVTVWNSRMRYVRLRKLSTWLGEMAYGGCDAAYLSAMRRTEMAYGGCRRWGTS